MQRALARQREFAPAAQPAALAALPITAPVDGVLQPLRTPPVPALGQPVGRLAVAAGLHESQVLRVGHRSDGDLEGLQEDGVARRLVVEGEALAIVADLRQAAFQAPPRGVLRRNGVRHHGRGCALVGRPQRVAPEQVLDVGEDQLLVLLLMLQAQFHQCRHVTRYLGLRQELLHARIHVGAVGPHGGQVGPRDQPALRARVLPPHAVVVRVEQHAERRIERSEAALVRLQDEGLEEPARVRQVPFDGAGVGHGLGAAVLGREGPRQRLGGRAHRGVAQRHRGLRLLRRRRQRGSRGWQAHVVSPGGITPGHAPWRTSRDRPSRPACA